MVANIGVMIVVLKECGGALTALEWMRHCLWYGGVGDGYGWE